MAAISQMPNSFRIPPAFVPGGNEISVNALRDCGDNQENPIEIESDTEDGSSSDGEDEDDDDLPPVSDLLRRSVRSRDENVADGPQRANIATRHSSTRRSPMPSNDHNACTDLGKADGAEGFGMSGSCRQDGGDGSGASGSSASNDATGAASGAASRNTFSPVVEYGITSQLCSNATRESGKRQRESASTQLSKRLRLAESPEVIPLAISPATTLAQSDPISLSDRATSSARNGTRPARFPSPSTVDARSDRTEGRQLEKITVSTSHEAGAGKANVEIAQSNACPATSEATLGDGGRSSSFAGTADWNEPVDASGNDDGCTGVGTDLAGAQRLPSSSGVVSSKDRAVSIPAQSHLSASHEKRSRTHHSVSDCVNRCSRTSTCRGHQAARRPSRLSRRRPAHPAAFTTNGYFESRCEKSNTPSCSDGQPNTSSASITDITIHPISSCTSVLILLGTGGVMPMCYHDDVATAIEGAIGAVQLESVAIKPLPPDAWLLTGLIREPVDEGIRDNDEQSTTQAFQTARKASRSARRLRSRRQRSYARSGNAGRRSSGSDSESDDISDATDESGDSKSESDGLGDGWTSHHIKGSPWAESEDEHLRKWTTMDGKPKWKAICRRFLRRTDASVCLRGHQLRVRARLRSPKQFL